MRKVTLRGGYDPYNSHAARVKAADTLEFSIDAEAVATVRKAQAAHVAPLELPHDLDWSLAEHVVMENGK